MTTEVLYDKSTRDVLRTTQQELKPWSLHNFGEREPWQPLMGAFEEASELTNFYSPANYNVEEIKDAVADITIYLCDYCTVLGLDIAELYVEQPVKIDQGLFINTLLIAMGKIAHAHLKKAQNVRISEDHVANIKYNIAKSILILENYCAMENYNYAQTVEMVWNRVKQRDWKRFPKNGRSE